MSTTAEQPEIRDASTIIVMRDRATNPRILMGQRGAKAVFMPNKYVFPGGAVDANDSDVAMVGALAPAEAQALAAESALSPSTLAAAAIRELWEETGQIIGRPAPWANAPPGWRGFAAAGYQPDPTHMSFVFRAVTPKGKPRRFDARFFLVDAAHLTTDADDFSRAEDELSHLHWVPLSEARHLDLPFITKVVLAELTSQEKNGTKPAQVPFFRNDDERHLVSRLGGRSPLDV